MAKQNSKEWLEFRRASVLRECHTVKRLSETANTKIKNRVTSAWQKKRISETTKKKKNYRRRIKFNLENVHSVECNWKWTESDNRRERLTCMAVHKYWVASWLDGDDNDDNGGGGDCDGNASRPWLQHYKHISFDSCGTIVFAVPILFNCLINIPNA